MYYHKNHTLLKFGVILVLMASFAFYGFQKSKKFINGPQITIETPANKSAVSDPYLQINGMAKNVSLLYLNGRQIFTDTEGKISENLLLARGYNIIEISGKDKFNREVKEQREIILK